MERFRATDGNWKCTVLRFNPFSHYHIYIAKSVFSSRGDLFENLGDTTVLKKRCLRKLPIKLLQEPMRWSFHLLNFLSQPFPEWSYK